MPLFFLLKLYEKIYKFVHNHIPSKIAGYIPCYLIPPYLPVLPNPPAPLSVSSSLLTSTKSTSRYGRNTS